MASLGTTSVPAIPDSRIARDATDLIRSVESDLLWHHSLRVYSWGALQGALRANAARDFLREHGVSGNALRTVWEAITSTAPRRERSRLAIRRSRTVFDAPVLDRSFGSMAEQRTTIRGASCMVTHIVGHVSHDVSDHSQGRRS
jgi:hypothetical protein